MKYHLILLLFVFAACESDVPDTIVLSKIALVDSVHFKYPDSTKAIIMDPVDSTVRFGIATSAVLSDSAIIYTYTSAAVGDTIESKMRKTWYSYLDTVHFHYDNIVDTLTTEGTQDQFILDSIRIVLPSVHTPTVIKRR